MKWEKCQIIMLPTEKASFIYSDGEHIYHCPSGVCFHENAKPQHLYILSDEEIKDGHWYYHIKYQEIHQRTNGNMLLGTKYKIIATTNPSLFIKFIYNNALHETQLPKPSDSFIKKYCELGGIDEVLVEYIEDESMDNIIDRDPMTDYPVYGDLLKLKISPDNTITIKDVKENWNREEVAEIIKKFDTDSNVGHFNRPTTRDNWIKENL